MHVSTKKSHTKNLCLIALLLCCAHQSFPHDVAATRSVYSNLITLGGSGKGGQPTDISYLHSDLSSLGDGDADISQISSQFTILNTDFANIEGTGKSGSGSTNTFNAANNSLADICGASFKTGTNSLAQLATSSALATVDTHVTTLGTSALATTTQASTIITDITNLGRSSGDISNVYTQFNTIEGASFNGTTDSLHAIATAISNIPSSDLTVIEGPAYTTAANSLASLAGTGTGVGKSGSTNTFSAALNSLADMCGTSFTTGRNSLAAISGSASFVPGTDSLHSISNNTIAVPFATAAQLTTAVTSLQGANSGANLTSIEGLGYGFTVSNNSLAAICGTGSGAGKTGSYNIFSPATNSLADICGVLYATGTDSLHNISVRTTTINNNITALATSSDVSQVYANFQALKGTSFNTNTDSLHSLSTTLASIQATLALLVTTFADPVVLVTTAKSNAALTTTVVSSSGSPSAYNTAIATALTAANTAVTTQSLTNTNAAVTALNTAQNAWTTFATTNGTAITSTYSQAQVQSAILQLLKALTILQGDQLS